MEYYAPFERNEEDVYILGLISRCIKLKNKSKVQNSVLTVVFYLRKERYNHYHLTCLYFPKETMVGKI